MLCPVSLHKGQRTLGSGTEFAEKWSHNLHYMEVFSYTANSRQQNGLSVKKWPFLLISAVRCSAWNSFREHFFMFFNDFECSFIRFFVYIFHHSSYLCCVVMAPKQRKRCFQTTRRRKIQLKMYESVFSMDKTGHRADQHI